MLKCKKDYYIILFSMMLIFCVAGSSSAVLMGAVTDSLYIELDKQVIYVEGTNNLEGSTDLASIPFDIQFVLDENGDVPVGDIRKAEIQFTYDSDLLEFVGATPHDDFGELLPNEYTLSDLNGVITYRITPSNAPDFPVTVGTITLANFEFKANCQPRANVNHLTLTGGTSVDVLLGTGGTNYYYPDLEGFATNGWVKTADYSVDIRISSQTIRGAVGGSISVPVTCWADAKIDNISFSIKYDSEKLQFTGMGDDDVYFDGVNTYVESFDVPDVGYNSVQFDLLTTDVSFANLSGEVTEHEIFSINFNVVNVWDGELTAVTFAANPIDPPIFFGIAQGDVGYCDILSQSLINPWGSISFLAGVLTLPGYAAEMVSSIDDENNLIWDDAETVQDVKIAINLCNNFDAGPRTYLTYRSITAVVEQPDILTRPQDGFLEQNEDISATFSWDYDGTSPDIYAIYQLYELPHISNEVPISECDVEGEGGVDLFYLNYKLDDASVTGFMGDEYTLDFHPSVTYPINSHNTQVEASRSNRVVTSGLGLTTTAIPFKVATGVFSCDLETSTSYSVTQQYYIRNSFDLASFKVKVAVTSGSHYVQSVTPATGVSYVIGHDHRSVTFTSNGDWVPVENGSKTQFAQIHFDNVVPELAALLGPGDNCYWIYSNSTIAFQDAFMSNLVNDDPLDPVGDQPFLFLAPNKIRKGTYRCPQDPIAQDRKLATETIPTEFGLHQNYPNPFNPETSIAFDLPEAAYVKIEIFNILGQHVKTLINEAKSAGSYEIQWNATDDNGRKVSSGIYFYLMQAGDYSRSAKMTLMK